MQPTPSMAVGDPMTPHAVLESSGLAARGGPDGGGDAPPATAPASPVKGSGIGDATTTAPPALVAVTTPAVPLAMPAPTAAATATATAAIAAPAPKPVKPAKEEPGGKSAPSAPATPSPAPKRKRNRERQGERGRRSSDATPKAERSAAAKADKDEDDEADEDEEGEIHCICDYTDEDGSSTVQCEKCLVWQHIICLGFNENSVPEHYFCHECEPRAVDRKAANALQRAHRAKNTKGRGGRGGTPRSRVASAAGGDDDDSDGSGPVDPGTEAPSASTPGGAASAGRSRHSSRDDGSGDGGSHVFGFDDHQTKPQQPLSREQRKMMHLWETIQRMEERERRNSRPRSDEGANIAGGDSSGAAIAGAPGTPSGTGAALGASGASPAGTQSAKKRKAPEPSGGPTTAVNAAQAQAASNVAGKRSRSASPHPDPSTQFTRRPSASNVTTAATAASAGGAGGIASASTAGGSNGANGAAGSMAAKRAKPLLARVRIDDAYLAYSGGPDPYTALSSPNGATSPLFGIGAVQRLTSSSGAEPTSPSVGGPPLIKGKKLWAQSFAQCDALTPPQSPLRDGGGAAATTPLPLKKKHVSFDLSNLTDGGRDGGAPSGSASPQVTDDASSNCGNGPSPAPSSAPSAATTPRAGPAPAALAAASRKPALKDEFPDILALVALADNLPPESVPSPVPAVSPGPNAQGPAAVSAPVAEPPGLAVAAPPPRPTPPTPAFMAASTWSQAVAAADALPPRAEAVAAPGPAPVASMDLGALLFPTAAPVSTPAPAPVAAAVPISPVVAPIRTTPAAVAPAPAAAVPAPGPAPVPATESSNAMAVDDVAASKTKVSLADYRNKKKVAPKVETPAPISVVPPGLNGTAVEPISPPAGPPAKGTLGGGGAPDYFSLPPAEPVSPVEVPFKAAVVPTFESISPTTSPRLVPKSAWAPGNA